MGRPTISICIPAYNRPAALGELLGSVVGQDCGDCEIVICEDNSPQRQKIRETVRAFQANHGEHIRYLENATNCGYDANLRTLVERATGEYCLFMGDDDLLCPGAVREVVGAVRRHPSVGVVLRSYASFEGTPENVRETFRYFDSERLFPASPASVITFFRRSVVISGMVVHREAALSYSTDRFDGTLLYQLHLVAQVLLDMNGVFLPQPLALYRLGGTPEFGGSLPERGKFVPRQQTPESSLNFVRGMLSIARHVEESRGVPVFRSIVRDIGHYSYPLLRIQAGLPVRKFVAYAIELARLGLWGTPLFYAFVGALLLLGPRRGDQLIRAIKARLGSTPVIGSLYGGELS